MQFSAELTDKPALNDAWFQTVIFIEKKLYNNYNYLRNNYNQEGYIYVPARKLY